MIESDIEELQELEEEINTQSDTGFKLKYTLSFLFKLFLVLILRVRTEAASFDSYKYYKVKHIGVSRKADIRGLKNCVMWVITHLNFTRNSVYCYKRQKKNSTHQRNYLINLS